MQKRTPSGQLGGTAIGEQIVSRVAPCPAAPECRRLIAEASALETADCRVCGQTLTRDDLARMLEAGV